MDKSLLERLLGPESRFGHIELLDEVDSTNAHAGRLYAAGALKDGAAIIARRQTAGRGRFGRKWESAGGLAMTAVVSLPCAPEDAGGAALVAGMAVCRGVSMAAERDFYLKYPNDILSARDGGKKVAGVLCELKSGGGWNALLIGVGVNLGQESFPPEIAESAVSLKQLGISVAPEAVAAGVLAEIERRVEIPFSQLREEWYSMDCTVGKTVTVKNPRLAVTGRAAGVDDGGALVLETADGQRRITAGDIFFGDQGDATGV